MYSKKLTNLLNKVPKDPNIKVGEDGNVNVLNAETLQELNDKTQETQFMHSADKFTRIIDYIERYKPEASQVIILYMTISKEETKKALIEKLISLRDFSQSPYTTEKNNKKGNINYYEYLLSQLYKDYSDELTTHIESKRVLQEVKDKKKEMFKLGGQNEEQKKLPENN